jgi:hypothetical protein
MYADQDGAAARNVAHLQNHGLVRAGTEAVDPELPELAREVGFSDLFEACYGG